MLSAVTGLMHRLFINQTVFLQKISPAALSSVDDVDAEFPFSALQNENFSYGIKSDFLKLPYWNLE